MAGCCLGKRLDACMLRRKHGTGFEDCTRKAGKRLQDVPRLVKASRRHLSFGRGWGTQQRMPEYSRRSRFTVDGKLWVEFRMPLKSSPYASVKPILVTPPNANCGVPLRIIILRASIISHDTISCNYRAGCEEEMLCCRCASASLWIPIA